MPRNSKKLTRIADGHYRGPKGEAKRLHGGSGAVHVRDARANWLVTWGGKSEVVSHLSIARSLIT